MTNRKDLITGIAVDKMGLHGAKGRFLEFLVFLSGVFARLELIHDNSLLGKFSRAPRLRNYFKDSLTGIITELLIVGPEILFLVKLNRKVQTVFLRIGLI